MCVCYFFFFSSRRRHTRLQGDWSSDVCSSDLYVRSVFRKLGEVSFEEIEAAYQSMEDEGRAALAQSGIAPDGIVIERAADMRYVGQEHAVTVDLPMAFFEGRDRSAIKRQFDELHKVRYGTSAPQEPADLVSLRVTVLEIGRAHV